MGFKKQQLTFDKIRNAQPVPNNNVFDSARKPPYNLRGNQLIYIATLYDQTNKMLIFSKILEHMDTCYR